LNITPPQVHELSESRRRLEWQSQLLDKMSEVQLRHSQRRGAAIKELLADVEAAGEMSAGASPVRGGGGGGKGCSGAALALVRAMRVSSGIGGGERCAATAMAAAAAAAAGGGSDGTSSCGEDDGSSLGLGGMLAGLAG
jgi:hypothetical protein